ncbi:MAG: DNA repair protein RecN, partial [Oscillospiraceae bacterium]|nr:DNA repair protein RecN [Oscillospiraceae bacterium]
AVFQPPFPSAWLEENGIFPDEDGNLLLSRELHQDGKGLCRIGDRPVSVSMLRALGGQLLQIHGQQDGQQLLNERLHLSYLDRFAGVEQMRNEYRNAFQKVKQLQAEMDTLQMDEAEKSRRIDTLQFQIEELEQANLQEGEEEGLRARRTLLRGAGKLIEALEEAEQCLMGNENMEGACSLLEEAWAALRIVSSISPETEALSSRLYEVIDAAQEVADQVRSFGDQFDFSPEELDRIEGRLDLLYRLRRKYGANTKEMLAYLEKSKEELEQIVLSEETLLQLEKKLEAAFKESKQRAEELSAARKTAAEQMESRIIRELQQLDMKRAQFYIEFIPKQGPYGLDETGMDQVQFLLSVNAGEALRPIHKIASGGELARIMLAIKNVVAEDDDVGTMVFDEVDTGVSGRAASRVAEKLRTIAKNRQVLCVTHLPQIAAAGTAHFLVEKQEHQGRTYTVLRSLSADERAEEITRIISGDRMTGSSMQNAKEMLEMWSKTREKT